MNIKKYHDETHKKQIITFIAIAVVLGLFVCLKQSSLLLFFNPDSVVESSISNRSLAAEQNSVPTSSLPSFSNNPEALSIFLHSIEYLEQLDFLSTEMQLTVSLFDHDFVGGGKYEELLDHESVPFLAQTSQQNEERNDSLNLSHLTYQKPVAFPLKKSLFRLHLKMFRQNSKASHEDSNDNILEIVCEKDQQTLWNYSSIEGTKNLTQINLEDLADALSRLNESEKQELLAKQVQLPCFMSGLPGLGGLSGTLKQLIHYYEFNEKPVQTTLAGGKIPVWKISGQLKKEHLEHYRQRLLEGFSENDPFCLGLTDNIPTHVEVNIGCKTPFPYRLAYFSQTDEKRKVQKQLFLLEYIRFNRNRSEVREENFIYRPPYITHERINEHYLQELIPQIEL